MPFSNYTRNATLEFWFGTSPIQRPTSLFMALHDYDPRLDGKGEVTGTGYARQPVKKDFVKTDEGVVSTSHDVEFRDLPKCSVGWLGFWDAAKGGNFIFGGALKTPKSVSKGDSFRVPKGRGSISIK